MGVFFPALPVEEPDRFAVYSFIDVATIVAKADEALAVRDAHSEAAANLDLCRVIMQEQTAAVLEYFYRSLRLSRDDDRATLRWLLKEFGHIDSRDYALNNAAYIKEIVHMVNENTAAQPEARDLMKELTTAYGLMLRTSSYATLLAARFTRLSMEVLHHCLKQVPALDRASLMEDLITEDALRARTIYVSKRTMEKLRLTPL